MVIVVMGEFETESNEVGKRLAEFLGWEFAGVDMLARAAHTESRMTHSQRISRVEALSAAIYSLTCEWRDVIISCPALTDEDQQHLFHNRPLVKFVQLTVPGKTGQSHLFDQPADVANPEMNRGAENDQSLLVVDSSQGVEHILGAVLSTLILRRRPSSIPAA